MENNSTTDKIILDTSDEAAQFKTVQGWCSSNGRFYGTDERTARYDGCTHRTCDCGALMLKEYTKCQICIEKKAIEKYNARPFKEWDGQEYIYSEVADKYFFNIDDLIDFLEEEDGLKAEDLRLVLCEANYPDNISLDYWESVLPEDGELPDELVQRVTELNKFIESLPPVSYYPGKVRTEYRPSK